jgi:hypothetical protein
MRCRGGLTAEGGAGGVVRGSLPAVCIVEDALASVPCCLLANATRCPSSAAKPSSSFSSSPPMAPLLHQLAELGRRDDEDGPLGVITSSHVQPPGWPEPPPCEEASSADVSLLLLHDPRVRGVLEPSAGVESLLRTFMDVTCQLVRLGEVLPANTCVVGGVGRRRSRRRKAGVWVGRGRGQEEEEEVWEEGEKNGRTDGENDNDDYDDDDDDDDDDDEWDL